MGVIDTIFQSFETVWLIFLYGWPFMLLVWIFILKMRWKAWPVDVVLIEKRGNNLVKTNDRAGKYEDPYTQMTGYRLQKAKDTIPVVNYDWVLHNVAVNTTLFERFVNLIRGNIGTLFLFRYGSKQYKPIVIKIRGQSTQKLTEVKDKDGKPILVNIYEQFDPRIYLGALEFEVVDWDNMNFMVQEQRASFERRKRKGEFLKQILIPLGAMAIAALVSILMIKFSYDYAIAMRGAAPPQAAEQPNIPVVSDIVPGA